MQMNRGNSDISLFKIGADANESLYVDGIPIDAAEREVARNDHFLNRKL